MTHTTPKVPSFMRQILSRRMMICAFTGFTSGLPLYFLYQLVPAWLREGGVNLSTIGLFSLVGLPFTWKFIWSPLMDGFTPKFLGRRRGWMVITQIMLLLLIGAFSLFTPNTENIKYIMLLALVTAFFSASQDIVIDAFRREILSDNELGLGNAIHVNVYRIASLVPGSLSLILADHLPWGQVFWITALFMLPGLFMALFMAKEPSIQTKVGNFQSFVIEPFKEFFGRKGVANALFVLVFIFSYKLGDSMATALSTPFYLDLGFSKTDIGLVVKNASLWSSIVFGILGGIWMLKLGINRALWVFGFVQMFTILGFAWLANFQHFDVINADALWKLGFVVAAEYAGVGLGTAVFVAYMARETNPLFTATQLALFTSLSAVPRTFINATTGYLIEWLGYTQFFLLCFVCAIPGMLLLLKAAPWSAKNPTREV